MKNHVRQPQSHRYACLYSLPLPQWCLIFLPSSIPQSPYGSNGSQRIYMKPYPVYTSQFKHALAAPAISVLLHQPDYEQWLIDEMWDVLIIKPNLYSGDCFLLFSMIPYCRECTDGSIVKKFSAPNHVNLSLPCIHNVPGHRKCVCVCVTPKSATSEGLKAHRVNISMHGR